MWELKSFFNSTFIWSICESMWVTMDSSSSWLQVVAMVRGKNRKRWEIKVGEKGRSFHGKTNVINYRYHCVQ
jgi:hypothetical protein